MKEIELLRSTPEKQGVSSGVIAALFQCLDKLEYMKSIIIMRHGRIIYENYWKPWNKETQGALWSLSKSFTSCAVGFARAEGLLTLEAPLIEFFPEYRSCVTDEKMFKVTLQDLLTMRSGHRQCALYSGWSEPAGDWVRGFLSSHLDFEPGTHFTYNTLATYMLSAVLRRVTGMNVREYLIPRLFEPLEIVPGIWESCPAGTNCGGYGLHLKPMDIAKFAQLLLNKGVWNGVQILDPDYLEEAVRPHADNSVNQHPDWKCGYGYQFWRSRHGFRADGACGQYAVVLPEEDMAVAVTATMSNMGQVLDLIWEKLLPYLESGPLPENPGAQALLDSLSSASGLEPLKTAGVAEKKKWRFVFFPNALEIESALLESGRKECTLTFRRGCEEEIIRAGFGEWRESRIKLHDRMSHAVASCAAVQGEGLEIKVVYLDEVYRDTWKIEFKENTAIFHWSTVCSPFRAALPPLAVREVCSY
jgi:CubicO group peptidase (beta-lactamase class C family)